MRSVRGFLALRVCGTLPRSRLLQSAHVYSVCIFSLRRLRGELFYFYLGKLVFPRALHIRAMRFAFRQCFFSLVAACSSSKKVSSRRADPLVQSPEMHCTLGAGLFLCKGKLCISSSDATRYGMDMRRARDARWDGMPAQRESNPRCWRSSSSSSARGSPFFSAWCTNTFALAVDGA